MKINTRQGLVFLAVFLISPVLLFAQDVDRQFQTGSFGNGTGLAGDNARPASGRNGVKVTNTNGNRVINVKELRRDIEIVVRGDGHIFVNITKHFGPDDLDSLVRRQPDLEEYVKSFPKTSDGKDVQLSIGLTSRYDGATEEELKEENNAAFNLYKKYSRQTNARSASRTGARRRAVFGNNQRQIGPFLPGDNNGQAHDPVPSGQDNNSGDNKGG